MTLAGPGCGKTRRAIELLGAELDRGMPPSRIAFVTFTRAARREALDRVGRSRALSERSFPWLRTIHSAAFRLLELHREQMMNDARWAEFARRYHYDLTIDGHPAEDDDLELVVPARRTADDLLRYVLGWGRNRLLTPERALARCRVEGVASSQYRLFVERFGRFKHEKGLLDFADLLEDVLTGEICPDVDVAFIDEAHDLSPLQIAVVEMWFESCERSYVFADDDQAIYSFQGADPTWVRQLVATCDTEVLTKSHRVPVAMHAFAARIIGQNSDRITKAYEPSDSLGEVLHCDLEQALDLVDGKRSAFVLCRNRMYFARVARGLMDRSVPFLVEGQGAYSPFSDSKVFTGSRVSERIAKGGWRGFYGHQLRAWLGLVSAGSELVPMGVKEMVRKLSPDHWLTRDVVEEEYGLATLIERVERDGPLLELNRLSDRVRRYLLAVIARFGRLPDQIDTILTTIHASKGREADLVVVLPDMTRTTHREYVRGITGGTSAENRVFYVAVTRAMKTLVLVRSTGRRAFHFPGIRMERGVL